MLSFILQAHGGVGCDSMNSGLDHDPVAAMTSDVSGCQLGHKAPQAAVQMMICQILLLCLRHSRLAR